MIRHRREIKQQIRKHGLRSTLPLLGLLQRATAGEIDQAVAYFSSRLKKKKKKMKRRTSGCDWSLTSPPDWGEETSKTAGQLHARRNVSNYQICSFYLRAEADSGDITFDPRPPPPPPPALLSPPSQVSDGACFSISGARYSS